MPTRTLASAFAERLGLWGEVQMLMRGYGTEGGGRRERAARPGEAVAQ